MAETKRPKQVDQTQFGKILPRELTREMEESYLDYAMSVIVSRALPDVRDGLKPVHRRILYAMWTIGLKAAAKYRKSATVVGEVLGKYHPHGDVAVYDTLVRMAQDFAMRYQLVDGQGNFGSIDGDAPAAMRYTESRMAKIAEELLTDIEKETIDFIPNYDGSTTEPKVLPAKLPNLLLNGALGIAVGMATNIPPHNLTELANAIIHLLDHPDADIDELIKHVKGPDFPTGGLIFNPDDIKTAYATGKGRIVMRGVAEIVDEGRSSQIVISALPYQVNKAELVLKIADLVKAKKLDGISDIRDESDREEGVRVVIDLKANAYPKKILNQLYASTPLESAFHVNLLALVDGLQPRVLTLKQVLEEYLKHRLVVIRRRTLYDLARAKERAHILEGLKKALDDIDAVIDVIRKSANREDALKNLIQKFTFTQAQANAILDMRLAALAALERQKVEDERTEKLALIKELEAILASEEKIRAIIKDEVTGIRDQYGDARRTQIIPHAVSGFRVEDLIPNEPVIVTLTTGGYVKRVAAATYRSQHRGGQGLTGMTTREEDVVEHLLSTWTHNDLLFFTDRGRIFSAKVYDVPAASRQAKGQALVNFIQLAPDEKVTAMIALDASVRQLAKYFFMGTEKGVVKKTAIDAYTHVRKSGMIAIKLRPEDTLRWVALTGGTDRVMLATRNGQAILFAETDVRPMGRSASGVTGIRLRSGDSVIAMAVISEIRDQRSEIRDENRKKRGRPADGPLLLTILENGFGKRTSVDEFRGQRRGGIGVRAAKVTPKTGKVISALLTQGEPGDLVLVSKNGVVIRIPLRSAKKLGRDTQGVTLMRLKSGDKVASVGLVAKEPEPVEPPPTTEVTEGAEAALSSPAKPEPAESEPEKPAAPESPEIVQLPATKKKPKAKPVGRRPENRKSQAKPNKEQPSGDEGPNYWGSGDVWKKK